MEDSISTYSSPSNKLESWKKTITRESLHISLRERERDGLWVGNQLLLGL